MVDVYLDKLLYAHALCSHQQYLMLAIVGSTIQNYGKNPNFNR
jgi:hypothetical protein